MAWPEIFNTLCYTTNFLGSQITIHRLLWTMEINFNLVKQNLKYFETHCLFGHSLNKAWHEHNYEIACAFNTKLSCKKLTKKVYTNLQIVSSIQHIILQLWYQSIWKSCNFRIDFVKNLFVLNMQSKKSIRIRTALALLRSRGSNILKTL